MVDINTNNISIATLKNELGKVNGSMGFQELFETGAPDVVNKWSETTGGTGSVAMSNGVCVLSTGANAGSQAKLVLNQLLAGVDMDIFDSTSAFTKFVWEARITFGTVANILETKTFVGFGKQTTSERDTDDICGLIIDGDAVKLILDQGSTEQLLSIKASISSTHLYRIEMTSDLVKVFYDGDLIGSLTSATNPLTENFIINCKNDGGVTASISFNMMRAWFE